MKQETNKIGEKMNSKKDEVVTKIMALKLMAKEIITLFDDEISFLEIQEAYKELTELETKLCQLQKENEKLKKELREYEILVNCSKLENFNPVNFQKGDEYEDNNTDDFAHNFN